MQDQEERLTTFVEEEEEEEDEVYPSMAFNDLDLELFPSMTTTDKKQAAYRDEDYEMEFDVDLERPASYATTALALFAATVVLVTSKRGGRSR